MANTFTDNTIIAPAFFVNAGTRSSPTLIPLVANGWTLANATITAVSNVKYAADTTSAAFTMTFPAAPNLQDFIEIIDAQQFWATHNLTINPNGNKINSSASNLVISSPARLVFVWCAGVQGWSKL